MSNAVELLGIGAPVFNPSFNYGEFATIKSQTGLNGYKISVKRWGVNLPKGERLTRPKQIAIRQMQTLTAPAALRKLGAPREANQ